jgi:hypothetical protein
MTSDDVSDQIISISTRKPINPADVPPPRKADEEQRFFAENNSPCKHIFVQYQVDTEKGTCKCGKCGEPLTPWFVFENLMKHESFWMRNMRENKASHERLNKQLEEQLKTKCQHCGKMTKIPRR